MYFPAKMPLNEVGRIARAVEAAGFSSLWCPETAITREALVQAALLMDATERLTIATGITSIYSRDALALKAGAAALEEAYPGRFVLGIGVSHKPLVEGRGHDYGKPLSAMREYLDTWDRHTRRQQPPLILAALRPRMLELARDRASGAHTYLVPVEHTVRARQIVGGSAVLAPEVTAVVEEDGERARAIARKFLGPYLELPNYHRNLATLGYQGDELDPGAPGERVVDDLVAIGSGSDVAARVDAHLAAGADHVCLQLLNDDPDALVSQLASVAAARGPVAE
jgi:probable F420-dependent oxidoreductase